MASTAKEERIQQIADNARRKDDRPAAMLSRMNAKDKQMTDLITQVTSMVTRRRDDDYNDNKSQHMRNPKRKVEGGNTSGGSGSGEGGKYLKLKGNDGRWTHPAEIWFSVGERDALHNQKNQMGSQLADQQEDALQRPCEGAGESG